MLIKTNKQKTSNFFLFLNKNNILKKTLGKDMRPSEIQ